MQLKCEVGVPPCENYRTSPELHSWPCGFENSWGDSMLTSVSELVLCILRFVSSFSFCVFSLFCVYFSSGYETQVSLISIKKFLHKTFTCIVDLIQVGEREGRENFYTLRRKRISNWKSDIFVRVLRSACNGGFGH